MPSELPTVYDPVSFQERILRRWASAHAFAAVPDGRPAGRRYAILMPLPNVTGALHMGHAMNNVMQDLLIRWHRMQGHNTLWQPGTDHAGIATQAVVEKRLLELEGKTRHDLGREALVDRIWAWKREYGERIVVQLQQMGCSADFARSRFTMDAVCTRAVREAFFRLFRDRLIYQGDRLVNWDCQLMTAVSDDEVYHEAVQGHFWHLRYPVIEPLPGEPTHVVVATTRPETMLGDTAVAVHPDPRGALASAMEAQRERLASASERDRSAARAELARLEAREGEALAALEQLVRMARAGRRVRLPLLGREIPLILDEWARPELGSGCVKITPAHDANDHEVWRRQAGAIGIVNLLRPDGRLAATAGPYEGLDRFEARERVVEDLRRAGLLEAVEAREIEIGHSDRSKTPIEPYLSRQWFVRMADVEGGVAFGVGTANRFTAPGLSQAALDVALDRPTPSGRTLAFHPDPRYRATYLAWLEEKRDWCISRQLWWGHRIPVWQTKAGDPGRIEDLLASLPRDADQLSALVIDEEGSAHSPGGRLPIGAARLQVCLRSEEADRAYAPALEALGLERDPDVLDTWFSSALWPLSTLGWPDPETAPTGIGERPLGAREGFPNSLDYYYPTSCLVTSRDILTLWVARMVMMGLYLRGDLPFSHVFVHAKILDGKGVTMSKSKGNGIDPLDIIERYGVDAMRYLICDMQTGTQDTRLPVQAECPGCGHMTELAEASHGRTIFTYLCPSCRTEFDVLGSMPDVPPATIVSDRFEIGRGFCNKLWNASRFALLHLGALEPRVLAPAELELEDRWILSRLSRTIREVHAQLQAYQPSAALSAARDFLWNELCDWYLELIKPRVRDPDSGGAARATLAVALDQVLRLLHPFLPFVTEAIWEQLAAQAPVRGIGRALEVPPLCMLSPWPEPRPDLEQPGLEAEFEQLRDVIRTVRDLRAQHGVSPGLALPGALEATGEARESLKRLEHHVRHLGRLESLAIGDAPEAPPRAAAERAGDVLVLVGELFDVEKERARLLQQRTKLEKQLEQSRCKLENPSFVERAKPEVVETERRRLAEAERELVALAERLATLDVNEP
jgi:valyl-tRNA synthetase